MSYQSDDGQHEGWAAAEFPGGLFATGSDAGGVLASPFAEASVQAFRTGNYELLPEGVRVDAATAIGWRGLCYCGWRGPLWVLVTSPAAHDLTEHRVYAELDTWADAPPEVDDAIHAEWLAHLPSPAVAAVAAAYDAVRQAEAALDRAVYQARADGASWDDIGEAAGGMRRQSAHARWAKTAPQPGVDIMHRPGGQPRAEDYARFIAGVPAEELRSTTGPEFRSRAKDAISRRQAGES